MEPTTSKPSILDNRPRDTLYYLDSVVFLVEDTLFKLPRLYFQSRSDVFKTIFTLPGFDGQSPEGSSDRNPFKLDGIAKVDFQCFLRVLIPLDPRASLTLTSEEWISVLKLSTMWEFLDIRTLAINTLTDLLKTDPVQKILLARQYQVATWLLGAYNELAKRDSTIALEEAERLGLEATVRLFQVRERFVPSSYSHRWNQDFTSTLRKIFERELKEIETTYSKP